MPHDDDQREYTPTGNGNGKKLIKTAAQKWAIGFVGTVLTAALLGPWYLYLDTHAIAQDKADKAEVEALKKEVQQKADVKKFEKVEEVSKRMDKWLWQQEVINRNFDKPVYDSTDTDTTSAGGNR